MTSLPPTPPLVLSETEDQHQRPRRIYHAAQNRTVSGLTRAMWNLAEHELQYVALWNDCWRADAGDGTPIPLTAYHLRQHVRLHRIRGPRRRAIWHFARRWDALVRTAARARKRAAAYDPFDYFGNPLYQLPPTTPLDLLLKGVGPEP